MAKAQNSKTKVLDVENVIIWEKIETRFPNLYRWFIQKAWLPKNNIFTEYPCELQLFTIFSSICMPKPIEFLRNLCHSNVRAKKGIHKDWEKIMIQAENELKNDKA